MRRGDTFMANGKPKKYPPEGYQIYVRVPEGDRTTAEDVNELLEELARLLSDKRKDVVVEPYLEKDPDVKKTALPKATGPRPANKVVAADGAGAGAAAAAPAHAPHTGG